MSACKRVSAGSSTDASCMTHHLIRNASENGVRLEFLAIPPGNPSLTPIFLRREIRV